MLFSIYQEYEVGPGQAERILQFLQIRRQEYRVREGFPHSLSPGLNQEQRRIFGIMRPDLNWNQIIRLLPHIIIINAMVLPLAADDASRHIAALSGTVARDFRRRWRTTTGDKARRSTPANA